MAKLGDLSGSSGKAMIEYLQAMQREAGAQQAKATVEKRERLQSQGSGR